MAGIESNRPSSLSQPQIGGPTPKQTFAPVDKTTIDTAKDMFSIGSIFKPVSNLAKFAVNLGFFGGRIVNEDARVTRHNETLLPKLQGTTPEQGREVLDRHQSEHRALEKDVMLNKGEAFFDATKDGVDAFQFLRKTPVVNKAVAVLDVGVELTKTITSGIDTGKKHMALRNLEGEIAKQGGVATQEQSRELTTLRTDFLESKTKLKTQAMESTLNSAKALAKASPHSTPVEVAAFLGKGLMTGYANYDPTVPFGQPSIKNPFND